MNRDYRPIPALDVYDPAALDEEDFDEMTPEARQEAERLMRKRDREEAAARGRLHRGLLYGIYWIFDIFVYFVIEVKFRPYLFTKKRLKWNLWDLGFVKSSCHSLFSW